jgi:hypothetical protein
VRAVVHVLRECPLNPAKYSVFIGYSGIAASCACLSLSEKPPASSFMAIDAFQLGSPRSAIAHSSSPNGASLQKIQNEKRE